MTESIWTLDEAVELVRSLHLPLSKIGWALGIAGGVLWRGHSAHDLDLVLVPYVKQESDLTAVSTLLWDLGWQRTHDVKQMHASWRSRGLSDTKHVEVWTYLGRRVDIISPATEVIG